MENTMKHTRNRLLALALALTMTLSTLATGALAVQQTDQAASTACDHHGCKDQRQMRQERQMEL